MDLCVPPKDAIPAYSSLSLPFMTKTYLINPIFGTGISEVNKIQLPSNILEFSGVVSL